MRNFERELEIYQNFVNNKITNFLQRIQQTIDQARLTHHKEQDKDKSKSQISVDKEKVDSFEKEVSQISEQIKFKQEYFEKIQDKILNKIDLSSF